MSAAEASEHPWLTALRAMLAPVPGRWQETLLVAFATTTALAFATIFQVPSFAGPIIAFAALQGSTVCTWRNMVRRILIVVGAGTILVPLGGFLVQTPWLLVPVFFLTVSTLTYGIPAARNPVESILVGFPLVTASYTGTFFPASIAVEMRDLVAACVIGVVVATAFAQLSSRRGPRRNLTESLAASYVRSRLRLASAMESYQAAATTLDRGEAPLYSDLGKHVQLLDLVRQEGIAATPERTLVTLTTAAERLESFIGTIDTLSRANVARGYRDALATEIAALLAAIDVALQRFERAVRWLATHDHPNPKYRGDPWPDMNALVAALQARQLALRADHAFARIDVGESANTNAMVQSLASIADVLHSPPWRLHDLAQAERLETPSVWPWSIFPLDRFALRYALQVALGATISLIVGFASHVPALSTLLWDSILVAQVSYGATIRKAWLRLAGVLAGGTLAVLTIIFVFANTNDITTWLVVVFFAAALCQYVLLGAGAYWYGPFQVAVTYFFVVVGSAPTVDVEASLWRAFGTFLGTAILFAVFRLVAPDYAGRQLVARFRDLLGIAVGYLPPPGRRLPPMSELVGARLGVARASADILRLVDEARLEGHGSGIDAAAAVETAGVALRIALRCGLIARGRATITWPALEPAVATSLEELRQAVRTRLVHDLEALEMRHTMARPGTRAHDAACAAAIEHCERERRDVDGPFASATAALAAARYGEIMAWPADASGALLAELEHLHRIVQLLPRLDAALAAMVLPPPEVTARRGVVPHPALAATVTRP